MDTELAQEIEDELNKIKVLINVFEDLKESSRIEDFNIKIHISPNLNLTLSSL